MLKSSKHGNEGWFWLKESDTSINSSVHKRRNFMAKIKVNGAYLIDGIEIKQCIGLI